jgi:hypothetical protein
MIFLKYIGPLIVALSIDAFDLLVAIAIFAVFFVAPGTVAGVAGGTYVCGTTCGAVGGVLGVVLDVVPFSHGILTSIAEPVGQAMGQVIDFAIDAVFGTGLIIWLLFTGLLKKEDLLSMGTTPFIIAKFIPFADMGPWYTAWVIKLILRKEAEEHVRLGKTAVRILSAALIAQGSMQAVSQNLGRAHRGNRYEPEAANAPEVAPEARARTPLMQDIRMPTPANNNEPLRAAA